MAAKKDYPSFVEAKNMKEAIESVGPRCLGAIENSDKFIYIDGIKY